MGSRYTRDEPRARKLHVPGVWADGPQPGATLGRRTGKRERHAKGDLVTDLNHLHLHVRDVERAWRFYTRHFGFAESVRHGDILFLRNRDGFDLALAPARAVESFPEWFHFGFRLDSAEAVRSLYRAMQVEGTTIRKPLVDDPDLVSFRCADPDGYGIEVYWE